MKSLEMLTYASLAAVTVAIIAFIYPSSTHQTSDDLCLTQSPVGDVLGTHLYTEFKNQRYCAYRGIRFAKAPIGDLRFKAPVAAEPWTGVYNASNYGSICPQSHSVFENAGSEDCLHINVFTPNATECGRGPLPVVASIYGGGFVVGLSDDWYFGADFLMEQCVVLVTMNYRLGPLGFLSLAQPEYSGNMGLKDQQLALKWTHDNIHAFGGNKDNVTIIGTSAGGVSVSFHTLNQESRKYFQRAIPISGTPLTYFGLQESNNHTDLVLDVAQRSGRNITNNHDLIEFLLNASVDELVEHGPPFWLARTLTVPWGPSVEGEYATKPFLSRDPNEIFENDPIDIPTIYMWTSMEQITFSLQDIENATRISDLDGNFTFLLPFHGLNQTACQGELRSVFDEVRQFYFGDAKIDETQMLAFEKLFSDTSIAYSVQHTAQLHAATSTAPVRVLLFNANTPVNLNYNHTGVRALPTEYKTAHGDDIAYVFRAKLFVDRYQLVKNGLGTDPEADNGYRAITAMVEIVANFAKTGLPSSPSSGLLRFPAINDAHVTDLSTIVEVTQNGSTVVRSDPFHTHYALWRSIEEQVNRIKLLECNQH